MISHARSRTLACSPQWLAAILVAVAFFVIFHKPSSAQTSASDFTIISLPDPQNAAQFFPQVLNSQTQWIANNRQALNIQMVMSEGDNVNDGASTAQMQNLDAAFRLLDTAGVPYLLGVGNHDYNGFNPKASRNLSGFNQWFGPGRYTGKAYFRGNSPSDSNANSYGILTINGQEYLFLMLEYRPTSASLDWAETILSANPDKEAIVVDHSFVLKNGKREDLCDDQDMPAGNATGQEVWTRLRKYNVIMVLSGHFTGGSGARRADLSDKDTLVNQLFANYQDDSNGGNGWLRIMTFHPSSNSISVQTYSPFLDKFMADGANQFALAYHNPFPSSGKGSISGRVREQAGCAAISGISVSAGGVSATTAADGTYSLSVGPGTYTVTASGSGWKSASKSEKVSDSLDTQMNFYLTTGTPSPTPTPTPPPSGCTAGPTSPSVTICSPANNAVVASPVRVVAATRDSVAVSFMQIYVDGAKTLTSSAGALDTSVTLATGTHRLTVQAKDTASMIFKQTISITVSNSPGPTPTPFPTPTPTPSPTPAPSPTPTPSGTGTISGKTTNISTGAAIAGVTVSASRGSATSNSLGNYTFASLPAGTYTVTATKSGWETQSKTASVVAGGNTSLNFSMATSGLISGTVKSPSGAGVAGASVTFKGGVLGITKTVTTSSSGSYSSNWIPIGNYTVTVSLSGHTTQAKSATVATGATTTLNFTNF